MIMTHFKEHHRAISTSLYSEVLTDPKELLNASIGISENHNPWASNTVLSIGRTQVYGSVSSTR